MHEGPKLNNGGTKISPKTSHMGLQVRRFITWTPLLCVT